MKKKFLLISAFGRGHWLAVQLKRLGIQVVLMDVTDKLGGWIPEEAEGPFGFFYSDRILETQLERLQEDDALVEAQSGFHLWLQDGPVELKGATTKHRLEKLGISEAVLNYINLGGVGADKIQNAKFEEKWFALLAHFYAANEFFPTIEAMQAKQMAPLLSTFYTRYASRIGHEKSLSWVERQEVEVLRGTEIVDISLQSRNEIKGIEYRTALTESSQIYECDHVIWSLTSEETGMLGSKPLTMLYPKGALEPLWYWARYRFRFSEGLVRESLPGHSVLIGDIGAPWTHENFMIVQRTGSRELFDVWIKLPNVQRFNKDYLMMRAEGIRQILLLKLVQAQVEIVDEPIGFEHTFNQTGPVRYPLFDRQEHREWRTAKIKNIHFDSAEQWAMSGMNGMFEHQIQIYNEIQKWWEALLSKQKKEVEL